MEAFHPHELSPSERFLGIFSSSPRVLNPADEGDEELLEDEVLWSSDFSRPATLSSPRKTPLRKTSFLKLSPSSALTIHNIPKPISSPRGRTIIPLSAPVNVPAAPRRSCRVGEDKEEEVPPHVMVARRQTPATSLSVLEGAGRTLKGRDLWRVRNAVWRQTGFLD